MYGIILLCCHLQAKPTNLLADVEDIKRDSLISPSRSDDAHTSLASLFPVAIFALLPRYSVPGGRRGPIQGCSTLRS